MTNARGRNWSRFTFLAILVVASAGSGQGRQDKPGGDDPPSDLRSLHKQDLEAFAKRFEAAGQKERARDLRKRWLDTKRRETLDARDADGRVALGDQYETMVDDRKTAAVLYLEALTIDPAQQRAIDGLVRLGYRKVKNRWVAPESSADRPRGEDRREVEVKPDASAGGDGLRGLTQSEVKIRLGGKPDRIVRIATQGRIIEQWIYRGTRESQYVNFANGSTSRPIVLDHYTLSESTDPGASR